MQKIIKHYNELTTNELYAILRVRVAVFVVEQHCPYQELDGYDKIAWHIWLQNEEGVQAYLRVVPPKTMGEAATLGRVLAVPRRQGLATQLLQEGIKVARERCKVHRITLSAQVYACALYKKLGFVITSDEFIEDDIPHIHMTLTL